jgi:hypothetical protein
MTDLLVKKTVSVVRLKQGYLLEVEVEDKKGMIQGTHIERSSHAFTTFLEALVLLTAEFKELDKQAEELHERLAKEK